MCELDLTFVCDCTGSMGSYIRSAQENIENIINKIIQFEKCDVRFALVEYRDHPPQDKSFNVRLTNFTTSLKEIKNAVNQMRASGGGDGPESVCCAFKTAVDLEWRENATKIIVWIADAPPHGMSFSGDGFPDGCPCKNDTLIEARRCSDKDILVYAVGTEPLGFSYLRTFMRIVAKITDGEYVSLTSANLLADLIVNGCREEIQIKRIVDTVKTELDNDSSFKDMNEKEQQKKIDQKVEEQSKKIEIDTTIVDNAFSEPLPEVPGIFFDCKDVKAFREICRNNKDIQVHLKGHQPSEFSFASRPIPMMCRSSIDTSYHMPLPTCAAPMSMMYSPPEEHMRMAEIKPINSMAPPEHFTQKVTSHRSALNEHQQGKIRSRVNKTYSKKPDDYY